MGESMLKLPSWMNSVLALSVALLFFYLMYYCFKSFSYWLFYEDMVRQTIHEIVKSVALK